MSDLFSKESPRIFKDNSVKFKDSFPSESQENFV